MFASLKDTTTNMSTTANKVIRIERLNSRLHIEGEYRLTPIELHNNCSGNEFLNWFCGPAQDPEAKAPVLHWYCNIHWTGPDAQKVVVTIGDYIVARWTLGAQEPIEFTNDKGYGPEHVHSRIDELSVGIISQIMGALWPKA
jgi:hypothetical protein